MPVLTDSTVNLSTGTGASHYAALLCSRLV